MKKNARFLIAAAVGALILVPATWFYLSLYFDGLSRPHFERYQEIAEETKALEWSRPFDPMWSECEVSEQYLEALEQCTWLKESKLNTQTLQVELNQLVSCTSPPISEVDPLVSDALQRCDMEVLVAASHCRSSESPFSIWRGVDPTANPNSFGVGLYTLGLLALLDGVLSDEGDGAMMTRRALAMMRVGRDMGRGSSLFTATIGANLEGYAASVLAYALKMPALKHEQLSYVARALRLHALEPLSPVDILKAEYLEVSLFLLQVLGPPPEGPPRAYILSPEEANSLASAPPREWQQYFLKEKERLALQFLEEWEVFFSTSSIESLSAREQVYKNTLGHFENYDRAMVKAQAGTELLLLFAHARLIHQESARWPTSIEPVLEQLEDQREDPFSEQPFRLVEKQGTRAIKSVRDAGDWPAPGSCLSGLEISLRLNTN